MPNDQASGDTNQPSQPLGTDSNRVFPQDQQKPPQNNLGNLAHQGASPFDLMDEIAGADLDTLAELLVRESSQYVAVVMSLLPAEKNVHLLEMFSSAAQNEILHRLETLQHIDEEILDEISRQLHAVIQRRNKVKTRQATGRVAIAKILSAAQRVQSGTIVQRIENRLETVQATLETRTDETSVGRDPSAAVYSKFSKVPEHRNQPAVPGGYQYSAAGGPVGAISAGRPDDLALAGSSSGMDESAGFYENPTGRLKSPQNDAQPEKSQQKDRSQLEQDLQSRINAARIQMGKGDQAERDFSSDHQSEGSALGELSPAQQLLAAQLDSSGLDPSRNESVDSLSSRGKVPQPAIRTSHDLEQSLLSDEIDSVQGFADQEIKITFERLQKCDRNSLQALLATAKPKLTLLALRGAPAGLTKKVLKMLPKGEAKEVEFRIQNMGPTRLADIQQAQDYLLRLATLLEKLGRFRFPRRFFS